MQAWASQNRMRGLRTDVPTCSSFSPDRLDQEGAAGESRVELRNRSSVPQDQGCPDDGTGLRAPDFNRPFLLQTDASDTGLGAILSQGHDGEEHLLMFISRKLTPAEQRYATVKREALTVKWEVLELRYYLLGCHFTLLTDHAPLQWMARAKETNAKVTRWFLALQDFNFTLQHRMGMANANADGLSHLWSALTGLSGSTSPLSPDLPAAPEV